MCLLLVEFVWCSDTPLSSGDLEVHSAFPTFLTAQCCDFLLFLFQFWWKMEMGKGMMMKRGISEGKYISGAVGRSKATRI